MFVLLFLEKFSLHTFNFQCQGMPVSCGIRVALWLSKAFWNDIFHKSVIPLVYKWWQLTSFGRPKLWFSVQNILKESPLSSPAIAGTDSHTMYLHGDSHCAELYQKIQKIPTSFPRCEYILSLSISYWALAVLLAPIMTEGIFIAILHITRAHPLHTLGKKRPQVSTCVEKVIRILPSIYHKPTGRKWPL